MLKGKSPKQKKKFRLLLDSAFAKPEFFPKLSKKVNIKHPVHDFGLSPQAEDEEIYQKAIEDNRFVLTINFKDFRNLVKPGKPGIFGVESQLTTKQLDEKVAKFLSNRDPADFLGKAIKIG